MLYQLALNEPVTEYPAVTAERWFQTLRSPLAPAARHHHLHAHHVLPTLVGLHQPFLRMHSKRTSADGDVEFIARADSVTAILLLQPMATGPAVGDLAHRFQPTIGVVCAVGTEVRLVSHKKDHVRTMRDFEHRESSDASSAVLR